MTQIPLEVTEAIKALNKGYPPPSTDKMDRRMKRLERLFRFYTDKTPEAPPKQAMLFRGFITSLVYAMTILKMYRALTRKIEALNLMIEELEK